MALDHGAGGVRRHRAVHHPSAQDYAAIVAAPDRAEADRATDKRRDPVKL